MTKNCAVWYTSCTQSTTANAPHLSWLEFLGIEVSAFRKSRCRFWSRCCGLLPLPKNIGIRVLRARLGLTSRPAHPSFPCFEKVLRFRFIDGWSRSRRVCRLAQSIHHAVSRNCVYDIRCATDPGRSTGGRSCSHRRRRTRGHQAHIWRRTEHVRG